MLATPFRFRRLLFCGGAGGGDSAPEYTFPRLLLHLPHLLLLLRCSVQNNVISLAFSGSVLLVVLSIRLLELPFLIASPLSRLSEKFPS